jgi:hypothetical protein
MSSIHQLCYELWRWNPIISPNQKIRTISDFEQPGCGIVIVKGEVLAVDNGAGMVRRIEINTLTSTPG